MECLPKVFNIEGIQLRQSGGQSRAQTAWRRMVFDVGQVGFELLASGRWSEEHEMDPGPGIAILISAHLGDVEFVFQTA